ncbi:MAG TPA: GDP-mannose 4,6-dehydratase [Gemmatimonadaceae bacterium]|nr:GDP-mannose 4,6-dehydratase [Gemmatimonadaceae bacterium]
MSTTALVTGGGGFVGQWLARGLLARGAAVVSVSLHSPTPGILAADEVEAVEWRHGDVRDADIVRRTIEEKRPDVVFHLAGLSFVPEARQAPATAYEINVLGAVRLLAAIAAFKALGKLDPVVIVVGSATQYGRHDAGEMPLDETAEQRPQDVYAASKAAQEIASLQMCRAEGVRVICTRSFNHSGVGHAEHFLLPALVRRVLALRGASHPRLPMGNQQSVRDYLHVADVVEAYLRLADKGAPGEVYNVCSGEGVSAGELAREVLLRVGLNAEITIDPALVRGVDVPVLVGSPAKLARTTGWRPTHSRSDIIDDLIHAATR